MTIQRYEFKITLGCVGKFPEIVEDAENGRWVRFSDHLTAMQREREVRAKLVAELAHIVTADYRAWDDGLNNPQEFVKWSKSRAVAALAAAKERG